MNEQRDESQGTPGRLPDDVWQKFEQDSWREIGRTAPKEPSARARMVADRLRREEEAAARRRPRTPKKPRRPRRVRVTRDGVRKTVIGLLVLAGVLAISALAAWLQYGRVF